jgi:integrase
LIASLEPEPKQFYVWDTKRKGLGVRVGASGTVAYVLKISLPGKRSAWLTMKARTLADAGIEYHEILTKHGKGEPLPKRQADTLWQDAVDRFEREHLPKLKPTTQSTYGSALKLVRAGFKNRPVRSIVYGDVRDFHESLSDRARQANVAVSLAGIVLDRCEAWGLRDLNTNPVTVLRKSGWTPNPEKERQRPLGDDELARLGGALRAMETTLGKDGLPKESPFPIAAVRLLLMTGKRLREILDLRWDQIDLPRRTIVWEDSKTGHMEAPLNDATLAILQGLPRVTGNPFVLPGAEQGKPIQDLTKFWRRLLKAAGIVNLTRHDLRHAHGNEAGGLGLNLQIVALLLGHHDPHTSGRYSKPTQHPGLEASEQVSQALAGKMKGKR